MINTGNSMVTLLRYWSLCHNFRIFHSSVFSQELHYTQTLLSTKKYFELYAIREKCWLLTLHFFGHIHKMLVFLLYTCSVHITNFSNYYFVLSKVWVQWNYWEIMMSDYIMALTVDPKPSKCNVSNHVIAHYANLVNMLAIGKKNWRTTFINTQWEKYFGWHIIHNPLLWEVMKVKSKNVLFDFFFWGGLPIQKQGHMSNCIGMHVIKLWHYWQNVKEIHWLLSLFCVQSKRKYSTTC